MKPFATIALILSFFICTQLSADIDQPSPPSPSVEEINHEVNKKLHKYDQLRRRIIEKVKAITEELEKEEKKIEQVLIEIHNYERENGIKISIFEGLTYEEKKAAVRAALKQQEISGSSTKAFYRTLKKIVDIINESKEIL